MGTKMMKKGLLTPIKYISNITKIFDAKEPELQIGLPTDVRHVGHIGAETNGAAPTWMNQYHSAPLNDPESPASSTNTNPWASQGDISTRGILTDSPLRDAQIINSPRSKPHHSRRYQSEGTTIPVDASDPAMKKKGRKVRKSKEGSGENSSRLIPDLPTIPKKSKKKSKGSEGSTKPRRKEAVVAPEEAIVEKPIEELEGIL
ncbi:hypothetical protein LUZ60_002303 [Juncus effusus]|nr:hypothetical protein LUZ60_002303 [Juncus effusus]